MKSLKSYGIGTGIIALLSLIFYGYKYAKDPGGSKVFDRGTGSGENGTFRGLGDMGIGQRSKFVRELKKHQNKPYRPNAGPDTFDCSGILQYCYAQSLGITTPRCITEQVEQAFNVKVFTDYVSPIDIVEFLEPGDALGMDYEPGGRFNHGIIYIGNNKFIQATGTPDCPDHPSRCKVVIDPVSRFTVKNVRAVYNYFS